MSDRAEIVKSGTWLYDGVVRRAVWIVKQNFDFYYEEGYEDQPEKLNENGELYQVITATLEGSVASVLDACFSLEEAVRWAENTIPGPIAWDNHRLQGLVLDRGYRIPEA